MHRRADRGQEDAHRLRAAFFAGETAGQPLAGLGQHVLRRVAVQDPRIRLEDLGERPVGEAAAVREAAPPHHPSLN